MKGLKKKKYRVKGDTLNTRSRRADRAHDKENH